jgi:hypothetical protein
MYIHIYIYIYLPHGPLAVGCPRNNRKNFRFEPKQTETQSVSVVFQFVSRNPKKKFPFVSVFWNKPPNNALYYGILETITFQFETKQNEPQSVSIVFQCVFS